MAYLTDYLIAFLSQSSKHENNILEQSINFYLYNNEINSHSLYRQLNFLLVILIDINKLIFTLNLIQYKRFVLLMQNTLLARSRTLADSFLKFVNYAVSPYHAVDWCRKQLSQRGYKELREIDNWTLQPGQKYFFTRNYTTLIAFNVGSKFDANATGFKVIGAHTDSPCLKINPVSKLTTKGIEQCSVSCYGGGLWHTWFDRDLILAGRVVYEEEGGNYTSALWRSDRPLLKIPNLAIHLSSDREKFQPNKETHLKPILDSVVVKNILEKHLAEEGKIFSKHNGGLVNLISDKLGIAPKNIIDFDLYFADANPSGLVGLNEDFISSARLDNLFSSFHALEAITEVQNNGSFVNIAALFDHEECGSESAQGAGSNIVHQSLYRIYKLLTQGKATGVDGFERTIQSSFLISADMAHAVHPNYSEKHQSNHAVQINKGVVVKVNYNQRYATDLVSSSLIKAVAIKAGVPLSEFVVKNDSACGSTIGPIIASKTGIKTVDLGAPMWGMHSIRQTCGVLDGAYYRDLFAGFYREFEHIGHNLLNN